MVSVADALLLKHHALVVTDNDFQRRARLLQSLWREAEGLPIGERRPGIPLGSRVPTPFGKATGANLMTPAGRTAARAEVAAKRAGSGQKIDEDRLWSNLLSSQPLAFNLFAELANDLGLATRVLRRLWPQRVATVTKIAFEHSPGRANPKYTHDRTAFDVYVEHATPERGLGFIGIEVKYHEALTDAPAKHRPRYEELTDAMGCFRPESFSKLRQPPVEQIWRDHMLAGSMLLDSQAKWGSGLYAFLHPAANAACCRATQLYREFLSDTRTFEAVTLENTIEAITLEARAEWAARLRDRYLGWEKIDALEAVARG